MRKWSVILPALFVGALFALGCSNGGGLPVSPDVGPEIISSQQADSIPNQGTTHLWGYYDVHIDVDTMEATPVLCRSVMFTANCVTFLNSISGGVGFEIYNIEDEIDYLDIDLIVSLRHPFPGMTKFNGYDVRGVFMGDGSAAISYNPDLLYPVVGEDQSFEPDPTDPDGANGHPDGYTRWFNLPEFSGAEMPLFLYTQGKYASPGFQGTATLCPYKYFADELGENESLTEWLNGNPDKHGVFSAGSTNKRDYKLRFPKAKPVTYGYAVVANWVGPNPEDHPANAPEAIGCASEQGGTVYYVDPDTWGGEIALTLDIYDWGAHELSVTMEDYQIYIESDALTSVYPFNSTDMTPIDGGDNYSTFSVEITADNLSSVVGHEYWVIVECADEDYSNEFDVINDAWNDPLAAFFRFDLEVAGFIPTEAPVCDLTINPCTLHYWDITDHVAVEFDATGSYDPDGDPMTFHWDFDGDDIYDEPGDDDYTGDPDNPTHDYFEDGIVNLKVEDSHGAFSICTLDVDITEHPSKNIPLLEGWEARDLAVDPGNGDLHILYYKQVGTSHYVETWKYSPCDLYTEPDEAFHVTPVGARYNRIDVSSSHYSLIGGPHQGCSGKVRNITPEGVDIGPNWIISCRDLWAFNDGGTWPLDHVTLYGWYNPPWNVGGHNTYVYRSPYSSFSTWYQAAVIYWGPSDPWTGPDKLFGNHVRGTEPVASGNQFWAVKDPGDGVTNDYYGTRWRLDNPGTFTGVNYDGAWFGAGVQTESDDGWYNARDITRNAGDDLLVLDRLSDDTGRVKAFTGDASGGAPIGAFDIPSDVNATPIRMDSSDYIDPIYDNLVYVLHGDSTDGYLLSIYFPEELPW